MPQRVLLLATICSLILTWLPATGLPLAAQEEPLQVYVLVGQSNMQGHADVRTLPHLQTGSKTRLLLEKIVDEQGRPRLIDNVWIAYRSANGEKSGTLTTGFGANDNKFGPELTFGICMQQRVQQPILLIKAAWGGKSLHTDFRPPGSGPYRFSESQLANLKRQGKDVDELRQEKASASGVYYRHTVEHVEHVLGNLDSYYPDYDPDHGYELAGLVWFQGWNDMVDGSTYPARREPGGYDEYSRLLAQLIRDFRKDLSAPQLPVVIGVMGVGGPTQDYGPNQQRYRQTHQNFRDAMAAPAQLDEFQGRVIAVLTENCWDEHLSELVARESAINSRINHARRQNQLQQLIGELVDEGVLSADRQVTLQAEADDRQLERDLREAYRRHAFTDEELEILTTGKSNAAYHYLGSGKIIARIGQAFADAMPLD